MKHLQASEEEAQAIKEKIIASRKRVHKTTGEQVAARWTFEEGVCINITNNLFSRSGDWCQIGQHSLFALIVKTDMSK